MPCQWFRNELDSTPPVDIIAIVVWKDVQTGHTLWIGKNPADIGTQCISDPVISIAIAPKIKPLPEKTRCRTGQNDKEDPSFRCWKTTKDSGEKTISWKAWVNCIWISKWYLKRPIRWTLLLVSHKWLTRGTITNKIEDQATPTRTSGGSGQFGRIDYIIWTQVSQAVGFKTLNQPLNWR